MGDPQIRPQKITDPRPNLPKITDPRSDPPLDIQIPYIYVYIQIPVQNLDHFPLAYKNPLYIFTSKSYRAQIRSPFPLFPWRRIMGLMVVTGHTEEVVRAAEMTALGHTAMAVALFRSDNSGGKWSSRSLKVFRADVLTL